MLASELEFVGWQFRVVYKDLTQ